MNFERTFEMLQQQFEMMQQQFEKLQSDVTELHNKLDAKQPAPLPDALPEFLTRKDVCNLLGITLPTLTNYYQSGVIPYHKIGKNVRFKKFDIYNAIQNMKPKQAYKK